jgi:hypothetical protein
MKESVRKFEDHVIFSRFVAKYLFKLFPLEDKCKELFSKMAKLPVRLNSKFLTIGQSITISLTKIENTHNRLFFETMKKNNQRANQIKEYSLRQKLRLVK